MRKSYLIFLVLFLTVTSGLADEELNDKIELTKKEYLQFVIGSYLWSFNEFGTDITISPNFIRINIYYDIDQRNDELVNSIKRGFESRIRKLIQPISWAGGYKVDVSIQSKAGINRWY